MLKELQLCLNKDNLRDNNYLPDPIIAIKQAEQLPAIEPAHKNIPTFWTGHIILDKKNHLILFLNYIQKLIAIHF